METVTSLTDRFRDPQVDPTYDRRRLRLASAMLTMGMLHFVVPGPFRRIVPRWFPWRAEAVAISGVAELASGLLMAFPRTKRVGGVARRRDAGGGVSRERADGSGRNLWKAAGESTCVAHVVAGAAADAVDRLRGKGGSGGLTRGGLGGPFGPNAPELTETCDVSLHLVRESWSASGRTGPRTSCDGGDPGRAACVAG